MSTLSAFQKEKLTYFFKFFEPNESNELDDKSLEHFMKRVLEYTGWDLQSEHSRTMREVHQAFFEILFDKMSDGTRASCTVSLDDWLSVWSNLLPGCKGIANFPIWLRLLPKQLFRIIDRDNDGKITTEELYNFYMHMVKLPVDEARANSHLAFAQMTDNGHYPLNLPNFEQIFSNFLLGQTPYGPGRHIFGCFEHQVPKTPFRLIQPAPDPDDFDMDVKVYLEKRPKRMSLTGI